MKIILECDSGTKQDIIEICKFLEKKWKPRKDVLSISIMEGCQDMTVEEAKALVNEICNGNNYKLNIIPIN